MRKMWCQTLIISVGAAYMQNDVILDACAEEEKIVVVIDGLLNSQIISIISNNNNHGHCNGVLSHV